MGERSRTEVDADSRKDSPESSPRAPERRARPTLPKRFQHAKAPPSGRRKRRRLRAISPLAERSRTLPVYLLAAAAILGALIVLRAESLAAEARNEWTSSQQEESERAGYVVRTIDYVFGAVGTSKVVEVETTFLRDDLKSYASQTKGRDRTALRTEARVQAQTLRTIQGGLDILSANDPYMQSPGLYFLAEHLASEFAVLRWRSPAALEQRGDELARQAVRTMFLSIVAAAAFLVGVVAVVSTRRKAFTAALSLLLLVAALAAFLILEVAS